MTPQLTDDQIGAIGLAIFLLIGFASLTAHTRYTNAKTRALNALTRRLRR